MKKKVTFVGSKSSSSSVMLQVKIILFEIINEGFGWKGAISNSANERVVNEF